MQREKEILALSFSQAWMEEHEEARAEALENSNLSNIPHRSDNCPCPEPVALQPLRARLPARARPSVT